MAVELEEYEKRVVVFIDILGFREHIKQTTEDNGYFIKLRNCLNFIANLKIENDNEKKKNPENKREITVFSDSIVISYSTEFEGSVFWLLLDVVHIQLEMMKMGILMRGGLTVGNLCHNDNIVYGPAMIEAYELESKAAIYPRVVVNEEVFNIAAQIATAFANDGKITHTAATDEVQEMKEMCCKDRDGHWFINFLSQSLEVNSVDNYFEALATLKNLISQEIEKNKLKPSIFLKYEWLKNYYNEVIAKFSKEEVEKWNIQILE